MPAFDADPLNEVDLATAQRAALSVIVCDHRHDTAELAARIAGGSLAGKAVHGPTYFGDCSILTQYSSV